MRVAGMDRARASGGAISTFPGHLAHKIKGFTSLNVTLAIVFGRALSVYAAHFFLWGPRGGVRIRISVYIVPLLRF